MRRIWVVVAALLAALGVAAAVAVASGTTETIGTTIATITYAIPTVTETVTTTVTAPTTTAAPAPTYLFDDEFNGVAGAKPDPTKWITFGNVCPSSTNWAESCIKNANAFQDGAGHLVLRVTNGTQGRAYDGAEIATNNLSGWPVNKVLYEYPAGTRLEARIKFAPGAGLWETFWSVAPESVTHNSLELDDQEWRGALPFNDTCHTHKAVEYGATINQGFDGSSGWHTYWQDYYSDHVVFGVDNLTCGQTSLPISPKESPILWNIVGPPGTWGGTGGPPPAADIPADMLVDYVRVSALP